MASLQDGHLNKGMLSPLSELFLEIQVNKLINDYLLSSTADEMSPPRALHQDGSGTLEFKENIASSAALSASNAHFGNPAIPFHEQFSHESQHAQNLVALDSPQPQQSQFRHSGEWSINLKDTKAQIVPYGAQSTRAPTSVCDVSSVILSLQNEGGKTAYLSRADTFPYTIKSELQVSGPYKDYTEMKINAKKPPRPPKLAPSLTRCFSEKGTLSQSLRRAKLERKRQSSSTSLWALLFTLCFAIIMIAQGFLSQGSQGLAAFSTNTSSPAKDYIKTSGLMAGKEGVVADSKYLPSSVERVNRQVQAEHLSVMVKHLDFGT